MALMTGPHATPPPHQQPVGSVPGPHAPRTGGRAWESAHLRTPHTQARGAPCRMPFCCPHSAESQPARARAVGLVTGCHAHPPRTHNQWVAGPSRTPQGRAVRRGRAPNPGRPTLRGEAPPPGRPRAAPTARKVSSQTALWDWSRVPTPTPPAPTEKGRRAPAACPKDGRWREGERRTLDAPQRGKGPLPAGALVPPPERTTPTCESVRCGYGDGPQSRTPGARGNKRSGPGRLPQGRTVGGGRVPNPGHPSTPVGNRTGDTSPPPPHQRQAEQGNQARNAEGLEPPGTALPATWEGTLRRERAKRQREGGSRDRRGCASTEAHNEQTARTERTTGPSSRNAQTTWKGVPVKRYPEPMAHGPEACEPSHPCGSRGHRLSAGYPCSLIRAIWNCICNQ